MSTFIIGRARPAVFLLFMVAAVVACRPLGSVDTFPGVDLSDPEVGGGVGIDTGVPTSLPLDASPRLDDADRATAEANAQDKTTDGGADPGPTAGADDGVLPAVEAEPTSEPTAEPTAEPPPAETAAPDDTPTPPADQTEAGEIIHIVQPGENLYQIGLLYNLTWQVIADYNGITNPDAIDVGQELRIPEEN